MDIIMAILGSSPIGALIGGLLGFFNRKLDLQSKKFDLEHDRAKWAHEATMRAADLEQTRAEADGMRAVKQIESDGMVESARMVAIARAQESDKPTASVLEQAGRFGRVLLVIGTFLQMLIRPVATILVVGAVLALNAELLALMRGKTWAGLTPAQQLETFNQAVGWLFGQGAMMLSYWFVSRGTGK